MHVAIIGAGAAGLAAARHATDPQIGFTVEVLEQTDELGGTWCYTDRVGSDEYGLPVHTSMYEGLIANLPKEVMGFPDFEFPDQERSYIPQADVLAYLQDYARHYKLENYIKYRHLVQKVEPIQNNRWLLTITDLCTRRQFQNEYDAVLVCNGHYAKAMIPDIPGMDLFEGRKMHSHDYRRASDYQGQKVLVIGGGPSGLDLSMQLVKHAEKIYDEIGACELNIGNVLEVSLEGQEGVEQVVILSYRRFELGVKLPREVQLQNTVERFTKTSAQFKNGATEEIDCVIFCTGYVYYFPFLSDSCKITVTKNHVEPLYKHVINIEHPTMAFIGLPFIVLQFLMFDYQARLSMKHLKGLIQLPSKEDMYKDTQNEMNLRWAKGYPKKHAHKLGADFQGPYFEDLARIAQIEEIPPVKLKIYAESTGKLNRSNVYKIIDRENFTKHTL